MRKPSSEGENAVKALMNKLWTFAASPAGPASAAYTERPDPT